MSLSDYTLRRFERIYLVKAPQNSNASGFRPFFIHSVIVSSQEQADGSSP